MEGRPVNTVSCLMQVDSIVKAAQKAVHSGTLSQARAEHDLVVAEAAKARKAYLQQVMDSLQYLRQHGLANTAKTAVNTILSRVDEAQSLPAERESEALPLVNSVQDAWGRLAASPPGSLSLWAKSLHRQASLRSSPCSPHNICPALLTHRVMM